MKLLYLIIGWTAVILGAAGVILPILPTTPFFLLAAFCFSKSSKRFHDWFVNSKLYQHHLESFVSERAMTLKTKIGLLSLASCMLLAAIYVMKQPYVKAVIVCLMVLKYYYFIFRIKTIPSKMA